MTGHRRQARQARTDRPDGSDGPPGSARTGAPGRRDRRGGGRRGRTGAVGFSLLLGAGALLLTSCASTADSVQGRSASPLLAYSSAKRTVDLELLAAAPSGSSQFNFDGASNGQMTITVPLGWKVNVTCSNDSTTLTHSCAIVEPNGSTPVFPGAAVAQPRRGVKPGSATVFSFVASKAGDYQIVCLVPGHRDAGMWDRFVVRSGGRPSITGAVS